MAELDDEEVVGQTPTKGRKNKPAAFKAELDDEEAVGGEPKRSPLAKAMLGDQPSTPGWLDTTKIPGTNDKSIKDFLKLLGGESAKGVMSGAATPFRMGWDAGNKGNAPDFENDIAGGMARGFPVAGAYMPETERDKQFQEQFPGTDKAANVAGAALPMLMTGGIGAPATATGTRFGLEALKGTGKWAGTQAAINTGVNTADRVARDPEGTMEDPINKLARPGAVDAGMSALPVVGGRMFSPTSRIAPLETLDANIARTGAGKTVDKVAEYIASNLTPKNLKDTVPTALGIHDAIAGIGKYLGRNQVFTPKRVAELNALAGMGVSAHNRATEMMDER